MSNPTTEQVVAALRCLDTGMPCENCYYQTKCSRVMNRDAADLIEQQAARIEELEANLAAAEEKAGKAEADANYAKDRLAQAIGEANQAKAEQWHDLTKKPDDLPEEHDSYFSKFYGTDKWQNSMFQKVSDNVIAAFADNNGGIVCAEAHTIDGKWSARGSIVLSKFTVVAWRPIPTLPKEVNHGE